jgi:nucleoid-associated protein YgaU
MTRETKIGLLVGLAFIIVIGILLSDQLMRSTEPPAAPLASVADTLRKGTVTPAPARAPIAQVTTPQDVSPDSAVPTRDDITRRPPPVTFVEVKPGAGQQIDPGTGAVVIGPGGRGGREANAGQIPVAPVGGAGRAIGLVGAENANNNGMTPIRTQLPDGTAGRSLADVAAAAGETLLGADGQPIRATRPLQTLAPQHKQGQPAQPQQQTQNATAGKPRPAAGGMKAYVAEAGDSLSRIAARQMGANTKANRDAIVRANPSLADDPGRIIIGVTYNIPAAAGQSAAAQAPAPQQERRERTERAAAPVKASGGEFWYEVRPGDSLWKIAKGQLGDASTVHAIKELNKESVKNWDVLLAGTRIKLPARPIASVQ